MQDYSKNMVRSGSALDTINILRLGYRESHYYVTRANQGHMEVNKGYWLNQCKQDKKALKEYADNMKARWLQGKL